MTGEPQRLHPDDLAAIVEGTARRVAELLREQAPAPAPRLLTAAQVAERFGVGRDWVYEHADDLGAVRLPGGGSRPRLRFDPRRVADALASRQVGEESEAPRGAPRRGRRPRIAATTVDGCPLLPVGGDS